MESHILKSLGIKIIITVKKLFRNAMPFLIVRPNISIPAIEMKQYTNMSF
jgi:hypothetical protein